MPAEFNKLGIYFQYPENWKLDDSDALLGRRSVTVYSPGGAFWSVSIHSWSSDPARVAEAVVKAIGKEYEGLEVEDVSENIAGFDMVGHDLSFFCLDLTNTAIIRSFQHGYATYMVYFQAEDREFEQLKKVFRAITISLLNGFSKRTYDDEG